MPPCPWAGGPTTSRPARAIAPDSPNSPRTNARAPVGRSGPARPDLRKPLGQPPVRPGLDATNGFRSRRTTRSRPPMRPSRRAWPSTKGHRPATSGPAGPPPSARLPTAAGSAALSARPLRSPRATPPPPPTSAPQSIPDRTPLSPHPPGPLRPAKRRAKDSCFVPRRGETDRLGRLRPSADSACADWG